MSEEGFKRLINESLKPIRDEQIELRRIIEEQVLPPLVYVETTVKSYADRYVTNEDHIQRLQKRVSKVEDNLGIQPSEELTIPVLD